MRFLCSLLNDFASSLCQISHIRNSSFNYRQRHPWSHYSLGVGFGHYQIQPKSWLQMKRWFGCEKMMRMIVVLHCPNIESVWRYVSSSLQVLLTFFRTIIFYQWQALPISFWHTKEKHTTVLCAPNNARLLNTDRSSSKFTSIHNSTPSPILSMCSWVSSNHLISPSTRSVIWRSSFVSYNITARLQSTL